MGRGMIAEGSRINQHAVNKRNRSIFIAELARR
jgi:hypothetical protein